MKPRPASARLSLVACCAASGALVACSPPPLELKKTPAEGYPDFTRRCFRTTDIPFVMKAVGWTLASRGRQIYGFDAERGTVTADRAVIRVERLGDDAVTVAFVRDWRDKPVLGEDEYYESLFTPLAKTLRLEPFSCRPPVRRPASPAPR